MAADDLAMADRLAPLIAQAELLAFQPRLWQIARRLGRTAHHSPDLRDCVQDGWVALCEAARRFDGRRSFAAFVARRLPGAMIDGLRKYDNRRTTVRRRISLPLDEARVADLRSPAPSILDVLINREELDRLRVLCRDLTNRETLILQRLFYDNIPQRHLARELGLSEQRIGQLRREALSKLRRGLTAPSPRSS